MESVKELVGFSALISMSIAAFGVLSAIAAASRHLIAFLAATLLALLGCLVLVFPDAAISFLVVAAGVGSLLVAIAGLHSRRRRVAIDQELAQLKRTVAQLEVAENLRLMRTLSSVPGQSPPPVEPKMDQHEARSRVSAETSGMPPTPPLDERQDQPSGAMLPAMGSAPIQPAELDQPKVETRKPRSRRRPAKKTDAPAISDVPTNASGTDA
jgi:hypothetical protein